MGLVEAEWDQFCDRIKAAGRASLQLRDDLSEREVSDGIRFLARVLVDAVTSQLGPPDYDGPFVNHFLDEFTAYGIPNTDNAYLFSPIDGTKTYRLSGNAKGRTFIVTVGTGEYPYWKYAEVSEMASSALTVDEQGNFELVLSAEEQDGNWFRMDPSVTLLMIRDYVDDWDADPSWFYLECIDPGFEPSVACLEPAAIQERLGRAADHFDWTTQFWTMYPDRWRGDTPNTFPETDRPDMVSGSLLDYRVGWVRLDPSEALIVEIEPPEGVYWAVQLYSRWGLPLEPQIAQSTLNSHQAVRDADGALRLVVSAEDPGLANWLDLRGYREAVIWYRVMSSEGSGTPKATVVSLRDIAAALPTAQKVSPDGRRATLAARQRSAARRFRR